MNEALKKINFRINQLTEGLACLERNGVDNSATDDMRARLDELESLRDALTD